MKKITGEMAEQHYEWIDDATGEIHNRKPEYTTMSKRPNGIGAAWYNKYRSDLYPSDSTIINGKEVKVPKYYDRLYEIDQLSDYQTMRGKRIRKAKTRESDQTPARLKVREQVARSRLGQLKRTLE